MTNPFKEQYEKEEAKLLDGPITTKQWNAMVKDPSKCVKYKLSALRVAFAERLPRDVDTFNKTLPLMKAIAELAATR